MTTAADYNHAEVISGRLTMDEIAELVRFFQAANGLAVDGKAGPLTQAAIDKLLPAPAPSPDHAVKFLANPLPILEGRKPAQITSGFGPRGGKQHNGVDLFYEWKENDRPDFVGDKGGATKRADGKPKWVVPYGISAIAAAPGRVQIAGNSKTGYRLWIDHGNGLRTGYFHLLDLKVAVGQDVVLGQALGLVGDNPADHDGRHLHFELSPVDRYAPIDPAPYLKL